MSTPSTIDYDALWQAAVTTLSSCSSLRISPSKVKPVRNGHVVVGGFGDVRQAQLRTTFFGPNLVVALKTLRPEGDRNQRIRVIASLARELAVWRQLSHPNILPLEGFYYDESCLASAWIVTPWLSNGHVLTYVEKTRPDVTQRSKLVLDAARGLAYLHGRRPAVCHGDIKAENTLVDDGGNARLCDFGLSKALEDVPSGLTTTKTTGCSLRYASPELVTSEELPHTLASDVWAWGCLYAVIMTGLLPYHTKNRDINIRSAIERMELPIDLTTINVPKVVCNTLKQCWQQQPKLRPTMVDCIKTLDPQWEALKPPPRSSLPPPAIETSLGNGTPTSELDAPAILLTPTLPQKTKLLSTAGASSFKIPAAPLLGSSREKSAMPSTDHVVPTNHPTPAPPPGPVIRLAYEAPPQPRSRHKRTSYHPDIQGYTQPSTSDARRSVEQLRARSLVPAPSNLTTTEHEKPQLGQRRDEEMPPSAVRERLDNFVFPSRSETRAMSRGTRSTVATPTEAPFQLNPQSAPLYSCTTIAPVRPFTTVNYMTLPMLELNVGDIVQVLYQAGHTSEHALPAFIDEDDDNLLAARDEHGKVGWVLASFLAPLV